MVRLNRVYWFGAGSLHNNDSSVDGTKHIRLAQMRCFDMTGSRVTWIGFTRENVVKNNYLELINLKQPDFNDDVRAFVKDKSTLYFDRTSAKLHENAGQLLDENPGVLFVELRPNLVKEGYEFSNEFNVQISLIDLFVSRGLPVFVCDEDCWRADIPRRLRDKIVLLRSYYNEPDPDEGFTRNYTWLFGWYVPEFEKKLVELSHKKIFDVVYCGNVYGRRDDFLFHMKPFHDQNNSVCVQGNWLRKKYDDRDFSLDNFPNFMFFGQTPHWSTLPSIALGKSVIHFSNPEQQRWGLPTARIFETLMGKSVVFCSSKIVGIDRLVPEELIVDGPCDLIEKWNRVNSANEWDKMFSLFEKKLKIRKHSYFSRVEQFCDIIINEFDHDERWVSR